MKKMFPVLEFVNIPNSVTTTGFLLGAFSMFFMVSGNLRIALMLLLFAGITDFLDGYLANKLNKATVFGVYLDTIVDFFNYAVLPMLCALLFVGREPYVIAAAFFYCACGLWRLAYYNVLKADGAKGFTGVPVPGAAEFTLTVLWFLVLFTPPFYTQIISAVYFLCGLAMISSVKFKKYGFMQIFFGLLCIGLIIYLIFLGDVTIPIVSTTP